MIKRKKNIRIVISMKSIKKCEKKREKLSDFPKC